MLVNQIDSGLHTRIGAAPTNFQAQLPAPHSELAQQLTRDPYVFDHLALTDRASEKALEQALMDRLEQTLTAFGHGMAFVGRQVRFDVGDQVLVLDLLLFHLTQLRFVVIELKIGDFEPGFLGQLGTYVAVVDDQVRHRDPHSPTVGILLCTGRDEAVVRYSLASAATPLAVATYDTLTPEQRAGLPDPAALTAALHDVLTHTSTAGHPPASAGNSDDDQDENQDENQDAGR